MSEQHRAMPWQWETIERKHYHAEFSCILELLHRVEALEATQHAHVDLSHLSDADRERMLKSIADPDRFEVLEVAQPAKPDSSLVERVAEAMQPGTFDWSAYEGEAREAIREVAAWLREQKVYGVGWVWAVERLEEEVER